jgi:hypothetical protein
MSFHTKKIIYLPVLLISTASTATAFAGFDIGPLTVGGAIRANYI